MSWRVCLENKVSSNSVKHRILWKNVDRNELQICWPSFNIDWLSYFYALLKDVYGFKAFPAAITIFKSALTVLKYGANSLLLLDFQISKFHNRFECRVLQECYQLTSAVIQKDPYALEAVPLHLISALELRKKNDLFLHAHRWLVDRSELNNFHKETIYRVYLSVPDLVESKMKVCFTFVTLMLQVTLRLWLFTLVY